MTTENMAEYIKLLTLTEQQMICNVMRNHSGELKYAHLTPTLLPFASLVDVRSALHKIRTRRPIARLISKLGSKGILPSARMVWLDDRKVMKIFGPKPERGRRLMWLPKKSAANGNPLDPLVQLYRVGRDQTAKNRSTYKVITHKIYEPAVIAWLADNLN